MPTETPAITQAMIALYDRFTHEGGNRRDLMAGLARLAGGTAAAAMIAPLIEARADAASFTNDNDARIFTQRVIWAGVNGATMAGYLVQPRSGAARLLKVVVIHENRGLNEHIRDVTRRLAMAGFVVLAPDFLSPLGETPRTGDGTNSADDIARQLIAGLDQGQVVANGLATLKWFEGYNVGRGVPAAVGFCWGGGMVNRLAVAAGKALRAGVAYYGPAPTDTRFAGEVKARMLLQLAGLDERVNATALPWATALKAAGVDTTVHVYDGVNHAFNNDSSVARYNANAAALAWQRTVAFLRA